METLRIIAISSTNARLLAWVVVYVPTRDAVVVGLHADVEESVRSLISDGAYKLRAVLDTVPVVSATKAPGRYASLLADLGLGVARFPARPGVAELPPATFDNAPRIGPVKGWQGDLDDAVLVQAGPRLVEIGQGGRETPFDGLLPEDNDAFELRWVALALPLPGMRVEAMVAGPSRLMWRIDGRVFTGTPLWSGSPDATEGTPEAALALPGGTLVYPGLRGALDLEVATVAQERRWSARFLASRAPRDVADLRPKSVPEGEMSTSGVRMVEPSAVSAVLGQWQILDVDGFAADGPTLPGAHRTDITELLAAVAEFSFDTAILVVSATGTRCEGAANRLINLGFRRVYRMNGGTEAWRVEGFPLDGSWLFEASNQDG